MLITGKEIAAFKCHRAALSDKTDCPYQSSAFQVYKDLSSKKKGKYFELIVHEKLQEMGFVVSALETTDHDRIVNGKVKLEIKGSLLWGTGTHFKWQQIRPAQDYDAICFLAVYPKGIELYGATKQAVKSALVFQDQRGYWPHNQHGGQKKNSGTFTFDAKPNDFPSWMHPLENILNSLLK